jgi:predicted TPR repeat methyltransferase
MRERGNLEAALELFRKVVAMDPDHADAHQNLGNCLGRLGRLDEGLGSLRRALELRPRAASAYRYLGAMLYAHDRVEEAAQVYAAWLSRMPEDPEAKHLLVACSARTHEAPARAPAEFVRGLFDRFAPSFDGTLARLQYRAPSLVVEAIAQTVGSPCGELDVLDIGCGTGLCAEGLRPFARSLVGVDLSARMLERARARKLYDALIECELIDHLQRNPDSYDLLASADTLVYFGALDVLAAAAASALRKGGYLAFTTERSEEAGAPAGYRLHPHGRYSHTRSYLERVFGAVGFEVVALREVEPRLEVGAWVPGWLAVARRR